MNKAFSDISLKDGRAIRNYLVVFNDAGGHIGRLFVDDGKLCFRGEVDKSAEMLMEQLLKIAEGKFGSQP